MSDVAPAEPLAESLQRHALFHDLPADALAGLVATVHEEQAGEGAWILREGNNDVGFYVILDGEVSVVLDGVEIAVLHAGMFFGEGSVLLDEATSADIVARSPVRLAVIDRAELVPLLLAHPTVALRLLQAEARRLADMNRWRA
jgi:CRP-like cAMP-binding protein